MELKHSQEMIREAIFLHRGERNMPKKKKKKGITVSKLVQK